MSARVVVMLVAALAGSAGAAPAADNCESIRAQVEAKVRAGGVAEFRLEVVDAQAKVAGKVVGSCALGTRKIVYTARAASAPASAERVLTECRDGRVTYGDCQR